MTLTGLHIPLITPFAADGTVDLAALERLAHAHLDSGADGLVALGTTGEPATLSPTERASVIDRIAGVTHERGAVLTVGAGSNSTAGTVESLLAVHPFADAALVSPPPYTRPSQAGVIEHFRIAGQASPVPIVVYDVPARTGCALSIDTLLELASMDGIVAFKHAVGAVTETTVRLLAEAPAGVSVLAGDDPFVGAVLALGGHGAISASASVAAGEFAALLAAWRERRIDEAREIGASLARLAEALFAEPNPTVIKGVLAAQGTIATAAVRLPLLPASDSSITAARRARLDSYA